MLWATSRQTSRRAAFAATVAAALLLMPIPADAQSSTATVKFRAFGAEGSPTPDLKPGDVALKVDGKPREIVKLEWIDLRPSVDTAAKPAATAAAKPTAEPPFHTNVASAKGRDVFIMVDEESIGPGRDGTAKDAVNYLLSALSAGDCAALISTRQGGPSMSLTTDHAAVRKAAASLGGYGIPSESPMDLTCRTVRRCRPCRPVTQCGWRYGRAGGGSDVHGVAALQGGRYQDDWRRRERGGEREPDRRSVPATGRGVPAPGRECAVGERRLLRRRAARRVGPRAAPRRTRRPRESRRRPRMARCCAPAPILRPRWPVSLRACPTTTPPLLPHRDRTSRGSKRVELTPVRSGLTLRAPRELTFARSGGKTTPRDMIRVRQSASTICRSVPPPSCREIRATTKSRILSLFEPLGSPARS